MNGSEESAGVQCDSCGDEDELRRVAAIDGDPHRWTGVPSFKPELPRVRPACRKELGCRCGRLKCPGVGGGF